MIMGVRGWTTDGLIVKEVNLHRPTGTVITVNNRLLGIMRITVATVAPVGETKLVLELTTVPAVRGHLGRYPLCLKRLRVAASVLMRTNGNNQNAFVLPLI
jgi:hypothetical protein